MKRIAYAAALALILVGCSSISNIQRGFAVDLSNLPALHDAAYRGKAELVSALVDAGIDVNSHDEQQNTPLIYAAFAGKAEIVSILLDAGAQVNRTGSYKATPLHAAAYAAKPNVAKLLLKAGANVHARAESSRTPLHHTVVSSRTNRAWRRNVWGQKAIMIVLIEANARIDSRDRFGLTPLHLAAVNQYPEALKILIDKGADVNEFNTKHNSTALGMVLGNYGGVRQLSGQRQRVIEILEAHGAYAKSPDF